MPGTRPGMTIQSKRVERSIQPPRFIGQHDRDAVADRIGELGRARDQLLFLRVIFQRTLGQRTDQDFKKFWIDGSGGRRGHRMFAPVQPHTKPSPACGGGWGGGVRLAACAGVDTYPLCLRFARLSPASGGEKSYCSGVSPEVLLLASSISVTAT